MAHPVRKSTDVETNLVPVTPAPVSLGTLQAASPSALIGSASEMAKALAETIKAQHLALTIQDRHYVRVEGWTTLGVMLGVVAREVCTVEHDGVYTATVELVRLSDQAVISRASAECGAPDEKDRYGKPLWANRPRYARRSMAQTRATGKACRLAFSWIMALAGYEPTPAEEMHEESPQAEKSIGKQSHAHRQIEARLQEFGLDRERVKAWCKKRWDVEHFPDLTPTQCSELLTRLPIFARQLAEKEAHAEREAIQAEAGPSPEARQQKAEALREQAKRIRQHAQYADGQAYYREIEEAQKLEAEAERLLGQ